MDPQSLLTNLKIWFEDYVLQFSADNPVIQKNIDLKAEHTRRVCQVIVTIGQSLDLSTEDLCLAEITALLHDIGRFEQFKRYKTFSDYKSEDHAALGVQVIESNRLLHSSAPEKTGIIIHAVRYHNHLTLPGDLTDRCLFFLKLLRDADKIDIWHVVTDYYENIMENRNQDIELGLPDEPHISMPVYHALMSGRLVRMSDLKTLNDFKLLQMGWIYDINFPKTFQIIGKKGYLEKIRKALPQSSIHAEEIYTRIKKYLEGKIHTV